MRRDLVAEVLDAASEELFEDVLYTHAPAGPITVSKAIFGVEIVSERFETFGQQMRTATHLTRALKAKFPDLARGDILRDGAAPDFADGVTYKVVDFQPPAQGDGRLEVEIGLTVVA